MTDPTPTLEEVFAILEERSAPGDFLDRALEGWGVGRPPAAPVAEPPATVLLPGAEIAAPAPSPAPAAADPPPASDEDEAGAKKDFAVLRRQKGAGRLRAVHLYPKRMRSLGLVTRILAEARKELGGEVRKALEWLDCADAVALRIPFTEPEGYPRLRLRLRALRANALRVAGDLPAADAIWAEIHALLEASPQDDPAAEAERCSLEASLRQTQRRFNDAEGLLERAEHLYSSIGDQVGRLKAIIKHGTTLEYAGDADRALRWKELAATLADPEVDVPLFWATRQNLANTLLHLGRGAEAAELLAAARPWLDRCTNADLTLRLTWYEGRAAGLEGRFAAGEQRLREAAQTCLDRNLHYDFARVSLDLAGLYVANGRPSTARRLAAAIEPVFRCQGVPAGAQEALRLFQRAARAERLDGALVAALRRYLEAACDDPGLPFDPPAVDLPP